MFNIFNVIKKAKTNLEVVFYCDRKKPIIF